MKSDQLRYHHLGIPTNKPLKDEVYLEKLGMYVSGYGKSPHNIEWMRFTEDSPMPALVKEVPHVAFEVDDLEKAIRNEEVLIEPNSPSEGVRVAFIVDNGAPVEFIEIRKTLHG